MTIRVTAYPDVAVWLDIPPYWGGQSWANAREWAGEVASGCWVDSGRSHDAADVEMLTEVLVMCTERWGPGVVQPEQAASPGLEVRTFLHLPDPRLQPFPARIMVADAVMMTDENATLRDLVGADDSLAVDPPRVEEFANPNLGTGLMAYRLRRMDAEPGQPKDYDHPLNAVIRYAFPVPGHEDKIVLSVSWPDIARLTAAREDIDNLARGLTFEYHPDDPNA